MSSNSTCPQPLQTNADISGIGVRISFYLQTFFLVLLVDRSWEDAPTALWNFIATSFGLTIAALVQHSQGQLTLYQALEVSNLVWLANFGTFLALASYSRRKSGYSHHDRKAKKEGKIKRKPENYVKFGAMLQTILSMILTLVLWAGAESLDDTSHCVTYVFFVVKAHAVGSGRIAALVITSILTTGYIVVTCHELYAWYKSPKSQREREQGNGHGHGRGQERRPSINSDNSRIPEEKATSPTMPSSPVTASSLTVPGSNPVADPSGSGTRHRRRDTGTRGQRANRPRKKQWSGGWDPMLLGIAAFQIIVFTYFVLSSELLLRWNGGDGSNGGWQFGQILALIVVIPSALSVFNAFKEHGFRRLHKKRKPRNRERSRQGTLDGTNAV